MEGVLVPRVVLGILLGGFVEGSVGIPGEGGKGWPAVGEVLGVSAVFRLFTANSFFF